MAAIDRALVAGEGHRPLSSQFGVSAKAIGRHAENHLTSAAVRAAALAAETVEMPLASNLIDQVRDLQSTALRLLVKAEAAGDLRTALAGVREAARCTELSAKLCGDLDEGATVNVLVNPAFVTIQSVILTALAPYPDARAAVVRALAGVA